MKQTPKSDERHRTDTITMSCSRQERELLRELAKNEGRSLSGQIRWMLRTHFQQAGAESTRSRERDRALAAFRR